MIFTIEAVFVGDKAKGSSYICGYILFVATDNRDNYDASLLYDPNIRISNCGRRKEDEVNSVLGLGTLLRCQL